MIAAGRCGELHDLREKEESKQQRHDRRQEEPEEKFFVRLKRM